MEFEIATRKCEYHSCTLQVEHRPENFGMNPLAGINYGLLCGYHYYPFSEIISEIKKEV